MILKTTEIKGYRKEKLKRQKGVCPLCRTTVAQSEATLDHDHDTGHVRDVLHRSCNSAEGRIKHWAGPRSRGEDHIEFLKNLVKYWERDYSKNPIHPKHGKPRPKRKRNAKRKRN